MLKSPVLCHFCHHNATRNRLIVSDCCKGGIVATKINFIEVMWFCLALSRRVERVFPYVFGCERLVENCREPWFAPNYTLTQASLHPCLARRRVESDPKKSGKWPEEGWKVARRRLESGPKKKLCYALSVRTRC